MSCSGNPKNCTCGCGLSKANPEPIMIQFPSLIKASISNGKRIIEFEASCASTDSEGDVISQEALLNSADYFIENGFLDVDHYAELGSNPDYSWLGIKNPNSWKVGIPLEVMDLGNYRTGVKAQIKQHPQGLDDPLVNKYDWLWNKLKAEPNLWKASIFGYPGADTQEGGCIIGTDGTVCATRYLVKSFKWCSTALTRNPINKSLKHPVVVMVKSFAAKMGNVDLDLLQPLTDTNILYREQLRKSYFLHMLTNCPETENGQNLTTITMVKHFMKCEGISYYLADVYALATSELINRVK
jgi:hypothetical protein